MANTAQDIIQDALETLGVYAAGETVSSADAARALFVLNKMIDEFSAQNIYIYNVVTTTCAVVSTTSVYTIGEGTGATITAARPPKIEMGDAAATFTTAGGSNPVNVVAAVQFQALQAYSPATSTPDTLYYDPTGYPNGKLNLLPLPSASGTLSFGAWQRITSYTTLSASYTLSDGVQDGITTNLAVMLKPYFVQANLDPTIAAAAAQAKDFLRYQGQLSRSMFKRFVLNSNPAAQQ